MEQSAKSIDYDHYKELQEENQRYNPSQLLALKLTVVSLSIYPIKVLADFSIGQNFQPLKISKVIIYIYIGSSIHRPHVVKLIVTALRFGYMSVPC